MALPGKMERLIGKIPIQSDMERELLSALTRRLERNLVTLHKVFGSDCAEGCYRQLIDCLFKEGDAACLDQYEQWVENCITSELGRVLSETEETLLGELLGQITGVTEALVTLGGLILAEEPDEEEGLSGAP